MPAAVELALLAQDTTNTVWDITLWSGVAIAILLVAGVVVLWLRARFLKSTESRSSAFSLEHLDRLYESGQLSRDEFRRLRRAALGLPEAPADGAQGQPALPGEAPGNDVEKNPAPGSSTPGADDDGMQ